MKAFVRKPLSWMNVLYEHYPFGEFGLSEHRYCVSLLMLPGSWVCSVQSMNIFVVHTSFTNYISIESIKGFHKIRWHIKNFKVWPEKLLLLRHCWFWTNWTLFWHRSFYTLLIPCKLVHDSEMSKQWISMNIVVVDTSSTIRLNIVWI